MVRVQRIPIFPLPLVLFPNMPLPLHIFEERYRRMMRHCIDNQEEFGVLQQTKDGYSRVGCSAQIRGILKEYEDGRFDLLSFGQERFRVRRFFGDQQNLEAEVEYFSDEEFEYDAHSDGLARMAAEGILNIAAEEDLYLDSEGLESMNPEQLSLVICGTDLLGMEQKQAMLESTDTLYRLEIAIQQIGKRLRRHRAEKKLEDLLGYKIDFASLVN